MSKHTPGPWIEVGRIDPSDKAIRIESSAEPKPGYQVCDVIDANGYEQNVANARLIAAAPDLLEALIDLTFQVEQFCIQQGEADFYTGQADAAIKKAKGAA